MVRFLAVVPITVILLLELLRYMLKDEDLLALLLRSSHDLSQYVVLHSLESQLAVRGLVDHLVFFSPVGLSRECQCDG